MTGITADRKGYVRGHRIHHGAVGVVCVVFGLGLLAHDWPDRRVWVSDLLRHYEAPLQGALAMEHNDGLNPHAVGLS